jgi:hypothetical protein
VPQAAHAKTACPEAQGKTKKTALYTKSNKSASAAKPLCRMARTLAGLTALCITRWPLVVVTLTLGASLHLPMHLLQGTTCMCTPAVPGAAAAAWNSASTCPAPLRTQALPMHTSTRPAGAGRAARGDPGTTLLLLLLLLAAAVVAVLLLPALGGDAGVAAGWAAVLEVARVAREPPERRSKSCCCWRSKKVASSLGAAAVASRGSSSLSLSEELLLLLLLLLEERERSRPAWSKGMAWRASAR